MGGDNNIDAIDGVYLANPSKDDKDYIALLIQQIGGPTLLSAVHRATGLPSNSTAYRQLRQTVQVNCSLKVTPIEILGNVTFTADQPTWTHQFKCDETYVDSRIPWDPRSNELIGFCYEHTQVFSLTMENFSRLLDEGDEMLELTGAI